MNLEGTIGDLSGVKWSRSPAAAIDSRSSSRMRDQNLDNGSEAPPVSSSEREALIFEVLNPNPNPSRTNQN